MKTDLWFRIAEHFINIRLAWSLIGYVKCLIPWWRLFQWNMMVSINLLGERFLLRDFCLTLDSDVRIHVCVCICIDISWYLHCWTMILWTSFTGFLGTKLWCSLDRTSASLVYSISYWPITVQTASCFWINSQTSDALEVVPILRIITFDNNYTITVMWCVHVYEECLILFVYKLMSFWNEPLNSLVT